MPHFNYETLPYAFIRDKESISVLDLKNLRSALLIPNSHFDKSPLQDELMVIEHHREKNQMDFIVVESKDEGKDSFVHRYSLQDD